MKDARKAEIRERKRGDWESKRTKENEIRHVTLKDGCRLRERVRGNHLKLN